MSIGSDVQPSLHNNLVEYKWRPYFNKRWKHIPASEMTFDLRNRLYNIYKTVCVIYLASTVIMSQIILALFFYYTNVQETPFSFLLYPFLFNDFLRQITYGWYYDLTYLRINVNLNRVNDMPYKWGISIS